MIEPSETFAIPAALELESFTTSSAFDGVRLSSRIIPAAGARRGGDWCEAFPVSHDTIALSIGDICGHGIGKFEAMTAVRRSIRGAASFEGDPAHALAEANRFLRRYDPDENATAIFGLLNTRRGTLVFANAGHPAPMMVCADGAIFLDFSQTDVPLGIMDDFMPVTHRFDVPAATLLVFYTDGVTERARLPLHGEAELRAAGLFAYQLEPILAAAVIERQMLLAGLNHDDAAILTAWTPHSRDTPPE